MPLGTTTMLNASRIGPHASSASASEVRQRHSGARGTGTVPAGAASALRYSTSRYRS